MCTSLCLLGLRNCVDDADSYNLLDVEFAHSTDLQILPLESGLVIPDRYHSYLLTYLRSWSLLEKLSIVQPFKKFPEFYGTQRFVAVFTRDLHWSLSWASSIQYIPSHTISLRTVLILFTDIRLGLPSGLFPSGFPANILYASLFSPFVLHALPISSSLTWSF
jgi:hypothetical protein